MDSEQLPGLTGPPAVSWSMRKLAEPLVLKSSFCAAALMSIACYPRLATAAEAHYPIWYLEALLFLGGTVLWAFVFAWYPQYTNRHLFTLRFGWRLWTLATGAGIAGALLLHFLMDPVLRAHRPSEFSPNILDWLARVLFSLGFTQLLLIFSPFAWLLRLFERGTTAVVLTMIFGLLVLVAKNRGGTLMPSELVGGLVIFRVSSSLLSTYLFWRGGVVLVWWHALILQSRHLLEFTG